MRNIFITGVTSGIGLSLFKLYLSKGWEVWGTGRHGKTLEVLRNVDPTHLNSAHTIDLELTNLDECDFVTKSFNANLDCLVISAAEFGSNSYFFDAINMVDFDNLIKINITSNLIIIKNLIPKLLATQSSISKLIFISTGNASIAGNKNNEMFGYKITKTAMNQCIKTISNDFNINKKIISVCLNPGWVKTKMGGLNATLDVDAAAINIYECIERLDASKNGRFINTDMSELPW